MCTVRPPLDIAEVPKFVSELYGIQVTVVKELDSYDDRNILVEIAHNSALPPHITTTTASTTNNSNSENGKPMRFLVKVHNEFFSASPQKLDMKSAIINHLTDAGYPTPRLIPTPKGTYQSMVSLTDPDTGKQAKCVLKLFEFLPGITLDSICLTRSLCYQMGKLGGWMDAIFMDVPLDKHKGIQELKMFWNLEELPLVREQFDFVQDKSRLPMIEEVISRFESTVLNSKEPLSKGIIHSDMNDGNALVQKAKSDANCVKVKGKPSICTSCDEDSYKLTSVIDFGDMTYSFHIIELAIPMAYLLMNMDNVKPMEVGASILSGYLEHMSLSTHELSLLHTCVCGRLVQSFVYGQVALVKDEDNADYNQIHSKRCWPLLETLWKLSGTEFINQLIALK